MRQRRSNGTGYGGSFSALGQAPRPGHDLECETIINWSVVIIGDAFLLIGLVTG